MPSPNAVWEQHGFGGRLDFVRWVIVSGLIANAREGRRSGSVSGLTTGDLTRALLKADGVFPGSLRDLERQVRSEKGTHRIEVRAALAVLLLDDLVKTATPNHRDVWHLSKESHERVFSDHSRSYHLTDGEIARKVTA